MSYQLYRNTTLGNSLQESLDELIQSQQITPQLALQVLLQFDKAINHSLASKVKNRISFKGRLNTYRFCDNVWTFVLNNVTFREVGESIKVDKVKIVACDGKESKGSEDWEILWNHRWQKTFDVNKYHNFLISFFVEKLLDNFLSFFSTTSVRVTINQKKLQPNVQKPRGVFKTQSFIYDGAFFCENS